MGIKAAASQSKGDVFSAARLTSFNGFDCIKNKHSIVPILVGDLRSLFQRSWVYAVPNATPSDILKARPRAVDIGETQDCGIEESTARPFSIQNTR